MRWPSIQMPAPPPMPDFVESLGDPMPVTLVEPADPWFWPRIISFVLLGLVFLVVLAWIFWPRKAKVATPTHRSLEAIRIDLQGASQQRDQAAFRSLLDELAGSPFLDRQRTQSPALWAELDHLRFAPKPPDPGAMQDLLRLLGDRRETSEPPAA